MNEDDKSFTSPQELLTLIKKQEQAKTHGKLKIFLGMVAGVGKTYAMLNEAHNLKRAGIDVVIGLVDPHERSETKKLIEGLPSIPLKEMEYRNSKFLELDIDEILIRRPKVVLVDELAHTNIIGSRHTKRYLDILEILDHGIDVLTCLNIQHLESLNDTINEITGMRVAETVPDSFLEAANEIIIIDLPPDELLKRLKEGKIYPSGNIDSALSNFFREGNLAALREIALRFLAEKVKLWLNDYKMLNKIPKVWKTGNTLLVGIFASPYSENLIRSTKRIASALNAKWYGVYVDNGSPMSDEEKKLLENNLNSVSAMGGEVITVKDDDVINGMIRVARQHQVNLIVVGKTKYTRGFVRFKESITERLFKESLEIDILAVSNDTVRNKISKIPKKTIGITTKQVAAGFIILAITSLLSYGASPYIGYRSIGFIFFLMTVLSAMFLRIEIVITMSILSGLIWDYFFIPPKFTLYISALEDWMMLILNLISAIIIGTLTARIKSKQKILESSQVITAELYHFTAIIAEAQDVQSMVSAAIQEINTIFNTKAGIFLKADALNYKIKLHSLSTINPDIKDEGIVLWVFENSKPAGRFTETLPSSPYYFVPIKTATGVLGIMAIDVRNLILLQHEEKILINNLCNQLAIGLYREQLTASLNEAKLSEETGRIYNTIMDCVSHELKTPLAIIQGASSALKEVEILNNVKAVTTLVNVIADGSDRMRYLVQNLLDMSRIEAGNIQLRKEPVSISELLSVSLSKLTQHEKTININIDEEQLIIEIDYVLMEQAVRNIINNAITHTPDGTIINIYAKQEYNKILITIEDNGAGLPIENPSKVFDKFYREHGKITGGIGIGLTISKSIIDLHGGTISASNRCDTHGAKFEIMLPIG
ncbi:MAG: sensor histidine kinase KdpD [Nitrospirae bacterium]|nr:sensor histidine kinase KdpD [Nitrospirota bacterium]MBF0541038.1 sensor histidine kinase KdpD [Nitrospirota bacterium]